MGNGKDKFFSQGVVMGAQYEVGGNVAGLQ